MTPLVALWLPIVLSAVVAFLASSLIHMVLPWHRSDYPPMPGEDRFMDAVRPLDIPPGDYMVPRPASMKEMGSPEFREKLQRGPVMMATVMPNGVQGMARNLVLWFVFCLIASVFAGYVAGSALPPGSDYLAVFRFAGVTAFACYAVAQWQASIWYRRAWSITLKLTIDGLIYALLTAGIFGWLWPR
jgi:hypothetical protein